MLRTKSKSPSPTRRRPFGSPHRHLLSSHPITHITTNLATVRHQLQVAEQKYKRAPNSVKLLAVSKTHPVPAIIEAYNAGQRAFGENYVAELVEKAPNCPPDIEWSFIGHLQSNKAKFLAQIPNLVMVETIDSKKLAQILNQKLLENNRKKPLNILVQVNTSEEDQKSGVEPSECIELVQFILKECNLLQFCGLMTIGKKIDETGTAAPYFAELNQCKAELLEKFKDVENFVKKEDFVMSMGMTGDYECAIEYGSTQIRVGTAIFGGRSYPPAPETKKE